MLKKFKNLILLSIIILFFSCQTTSQTSNKAVVKEFEEFVAAVENKVETETTESWEEIEATYQSKKLAAEKQFSQWDAQTQERWQTLEDRFEDAREQLVEQKAEAIVDDFAEARQRFGRYIQSVEDSVNQKTVRSWEQIESQYKKERDNLNQYLDSATETAREEIQTLEKRFENSRKAWQETEKVES
jgi:ElaB/YqjD/DUF883 family membrane-anchored ribosome-binding protein